ncbi:hypothetical protein D3C78_1651620 [compost metagenome]
MYVASYADAWIERQVIDDFESLREFDSEPPPDLIESRGWINREGVFLDRLPLVRQTDGLEEEWIWKSW